MRSDIVPGGVFPDYELPDHTTPTPTPVRLDFAKPGMPAAGLPSMAGTGGVRNGSRPSLSASRAEHVLVPTTPGRC